MTSLILILGTFALAFPPQDADAAHTSGTGKIEIFKGVVLFATFGPAVDPSCGAVPCNVFIDIPKRFEALIKRDCLQSGGSVSIPIGLTQASRTCTNANGPWGVVLTGTINAAHDSIATVNVVAT